MRNVILLCHKYYKYRTICKKRKRTATVSQPPDDGDSLAASYFILLQLTAPFPIGNEYNLRVSGLFVDDNDKTLHSLN